MGACGVLMRFVLGGLVVSFFAAAGGAFKPKTFAGLFGAAPTVALASLGLAYHEHGPAYVSKLGHSMLLGGLALLVYSACCVLLIRLSALPVALGAVLAWSSWAAVTVALFWCVRA